MLQTFPKNSPFLALPSCITKRTQIIQCYSVVGLNFTKLISFTDIYHVVKKQIIIETVQLLNTGNLYHSRHTDHCSVMCRCVLLTNTGRDFGLRHRLTWRLLYRMMDCQKGSSSVMCPSTTGAISSSRPRNNWRCCLVHGDGTSMPLSGSSDHHLRSFSASAFIRSDGSYLPPPLSLLSHHLCYHQHFTLS